MADATTLAATVGSTAKPNLIVSTVEQPPYVVQHADNEYSGFLVKVLQHISEQVGFTYTIKHAKDGKFGEMDGTGKWSGIIGEVERGEAQVGLAAFTTEADRENVISFTKPIMQDSVSLLVKKPYWFDLGLGYLVRPFAAEMWITLLVILLLIGIVFFIIGKFSPYEWGNQAADKDPRGARNSFSLRNSYLFAISTLTWQGYREAPRSLSGRIVAAFWWMLVMFTLVAYTANLTAYMLARPEQIPDLKFKTYEDLVENNDFKVAALHFGSTEKWLMSQPPGTLRSLWTKMSKQDSFVGSYQEALDRVENSNGNTVAFIRKMTGLHLARNSDKCNVMMYGPEKYASSLALALKKNFYLKSEIDRVIEKMLTNGMMQELIDEFWKLSGNCDNVDGSKFTSKGGTLSSMPVYPVTLKDMAVALILFFLGLIAAIIGLIIEIVHYQVTKQGKKLHRPAIVKNPPKIWKPKPRASKPAPTETEATEGEAGASADPDALENVPLDDTPADTVETVDESEKPLTEESGKVEV